ncbi:HTH-type transcriptional regulator YhaJ [Thalassocella blandensis]|nr:HTH-type transcriptional regulator YhaJ [Thalassocella blandensis]
MNNLPKITLEQWAAFKAVVDEGSFARAAEVLNKSQSTVSYSLAKMEERLPAPVLKISGRKAELTDFGKSMYRQASQLLEQALLLDKVAECHARGWEDEVTIAVDGITPIEQIFCSLQQFSLDNPQTRIRMLETTLSGTDEALLMREADIAITGYVPPGFLAQPYRTINKIAVVSPKHPLMQAPLPVTEQELRRHRQIVIRDSGKKREKDAGWLGSEQRWTVSHFSTSITAIKAGLGFGFVPKEKVLHELERGELVALPVEPGFEREIPLFLVIANQQLAGPATKAVAQSLLDGARKNTYLQHKQAME